MIAAAAALVCGVAVLASLNLWYLSKLQSEQVHVDAAQSVLDLGIHMTSLLSARAGAACSESPAARQDVLRLLLSLKELEPSLQYVSITDGDITLFHEDLSQAPGVTATNSSVVIGRRILATGSSYVPVLTFTAPIPDAPPSRRLHVAMARDAVTQRESHAAAVLALMFRLAMATVIVAFLLAILLVVWILRHEMIVQQRQRDAEHMAFAGILANGIIHDVRNPLSSLRLDIQMIQKEAGKQAGTDPSRLGALASRARQTMDRLDAVMREFLFVSRPESTIWEPVDVNACLQDCADLLRGRFERAHVSLVMNLDKTLPMVGGHDVGLKRAITNVMINAIQVSPAGGTVTLSTLQSGGRVLIRIEDEGPGVPAGETTRIFEMFVTGTPGGTGLGLYLARVAIEKLKGSIGVTNRPTGGACFVISLPVGGLPGALKGPNGPLSGIDAGA